MDTKRIAHGEKSAERNRRRIAKTGVTPMGDFVWTDEEKQILRDLSPDRAAIAKALPHRKKNAIAAMLRKLKLKRPYRFWPPEEIARLRHLFPRASLEKIAESFPGRSMRRIYKVASMRKFKRPRKPYKETGILVIDQIRARCFELRYSMPDLDAMTGCGEYFDSQRWSHGWMNHKAIARAVHELGGHMTAVWDDDKYDRKR